MRRAILSAVLVSTVVAAQGFDPVVGNWRGTMTSAAGVDSPIIITIAKKGDGYAGSTSGFTASTESALKRLTVNGTTVSLEAADDSKLGAVSLAADLAVEGNALKGAGIVSIGRRSSTSRWRCSGVRGRRRFSRTSSSGSTTSSDAGSSSMSARSIRR